MLVNIVTLDGNTKQYHNSKKIFDWTISVKNEGKFNIYLIYKENGELEGFGWRDEEIDSLRIILSLVETNAYKNGIIPLTLTEYRKKVNEVRRLKVSKNKSNSYSLYIPSTWAKEFLSDDMYVDVSYEGDSIVIRKSKDNHNSISE